MARLRGRAPRGERCRAPMPPGHWKTTTFTDALRLSGMTAPLVLGGRMNRVAFLADGEPVLVPTLGSSETVIMDNPPAHKQQGVREAFEQVGDRLAYMPPCSPDFNTIENAFAKLKALLRKTAARKIPELWRAIAIADAMPQLTLAECVNHFIATGHEPE
jgi:transposase